MLMNALAFVVVFGIQLTIGAGDGLRSFVGFEAQVARLMFFRHFFIAQSVVTEHEIVVRLQIFGIDGEHLLQSFHRHRSICVQEKNAAEIVQRHAIVGILSQDFRQMLAAPS